MHVLLIPSWYKTPQQPNVGTFFEEQARMLMRLGVKVGILYPKIDLTFSSRWKPGETAPANFIDGELPTYYSFSKSIVPRSRRINFWYVGVKADKTFKKYVEVHGMPDILHAHAVFSGGIVAAYLANKYDLRFVLTEHFTGLILEDVRNIPASYQQIRRVFKLSAANLVVSADFRLKLLDIYSLQADRIRVLHNVVNPIFFSVEEPPARQPFIFVVNSFLTEKKNHQLLFESFQLVLKVYNCRLKIIGDGKLREYLERLTVELQINEYVEFYGNVDRLAVKAVLDRSHALVSTSIFETFGVNVTEALASGRPVVVTNSGGPKDFVKPYNGILVEEYSKEVFSNAMIRLINSYDSYDQNYISGMCRAKFSEEVIGPQLKSVYQEVLSGTL